MKKPKLSKPSFTSIKSLSKKRIAVLLVALLILVAGVTIFAFLYNQNSEQTSTDENRNKLLDLPEEEREEFVQNFTSSQSDVQEKAEAKRYRLNQVLLNCDNTCSGTIHLTELGEEREEFVAFKINEQTKLVHNGQSESLKKLEQLAQSKTMVGLIISDSSQGTLSEISY